MKINGEFQTQEGMEIQKFKYTHVSEASIRIEILKSKFEHFFIIVKDPKGIQRALFTFKTRQKKFYIGKNFSECSNGAIPGNMISGDWEITIAKTYNVGNNFELDIQSVDGLPEEVLCFDILNQDRNLIFETQSKYYAGDLHIHSNYSDGRISLEKVVEATKNKQLEFVAHTDHSVVTTHYPNIDYPVIPSTEITWDNLGHYNVYGLKSILAYDEYITKNIGNKSDVLNQMFSLFSNEGLLISINHPFAKGINLKHNIDMNNICLIEILNAPHLLDKETDNEKAVRFFDFLWNEGFKIFGIGGSDAHKDNYFDRYPIGIPTTKIFCEGLSINNVLSSMKAGNCFVESFINFELFMTDKNKNVILPGTKVNGEVKIISRSKEIVEYILIKNGKITDKKVGKYYSKEIKIEKGEFYRLEAWFDGEIVFFMNPIHDINLVPKEYDFLKLVSKFDPNYIHNK